MISAAVEAAYNSASDRMPGVSLEEFAKALESSDVHPVCVRGKCVGAVIVNGCEIHACILESARGLWFGRKQAQILSAVLQKHGVAATRATTEHGVKFVQRLGFRQFGSLWLKGLRYGH